MKTIEQQLEEVARRPGASYTINTAEACGLLRKLGLMPKSAAQIYAEAGAPPDELGEDD